MEQKMVEVPFDVELAKKITNGKIEGKIVTRSGKNVRIVCFDRKSELNRFPILALIENGIVETSYIFNSKGYTNFYGLKTSSDLFIEIPEYMTFKDGDVMVSNDGSFMFLLSTKGKCKTSLYASVRDGKLLRVCDVEAGFAANGDRIDLYHRGNDKQVRIFINLLKSSKEPKAKEYLKRFFGIEVKSEHEFKPFDKVLVRNSIEMEWIPRFFERATQCSQSVRYITLDNNSWKYCIPYNENTAHLLGTIEDYKED